MDVADSFLELSCVRIALVPAGPPMPDHRYEELAAHLTAFREIPVSSLPRRAAVPRVTGSSTFTGVPAGFRDAIEAASPSALLRSRSATRDIGQTARESLASPTGKGLARRNASLSYSSVRLGSDAVAYRRTSQPQRGSPRNTADLDMGSAEVDCSFRLRYDVMYRDQGGGLIMKPFSEWDDFHSSKIWGVFGVVDCTQLSIEHGLERREQAVFEAYDDFNATLKHFKDAPVRRLLIFTAQEGQPNVPFVINDPKSPSRSEQRPLPFSVGYVPERSKLEETRQEFKAQISHFAGLLLNAIDKDSWKRRESPSTELFLSPIDEKYTIDRHSKLTKRRAGRLDKLLADGMLLMGRPNEALIKYNSAIEKAKANSDRLWLAGAMEGWSAAHVLSYVGAGGAVSDSSLSDKLIEHYADIYKLYQKKRVAEPEAAAALRLAGFLGRWTERRKDALDAAEHAATVGEGLRVQKRGALWEALARFSDRMGCRRKAALFLYRLGHLNASQSIWSSAVTLMIAAEKQLSRDGKKPWPDLNRAVMITAAGHAEEAGDSNTAARLYIEALVLLPLLSAARKEEDESLIKSLSRAQIPVYLPAANGLVLLEDVSALQIPGLSIREREDVAKATALTSGGMDGPFIYNPFEAKKRAKAAAVARRAVTWVCGEPAQVSVRLRNNTCTELAVDIMAVLLSQHDEDGDVGELLDETSGREEDTFGTNEDEVSNSTRRSRLVRRALQDSSRIAETRSETVVLRSGESKSGNVKQLTVIPKRTGPLHVRGLLVRLFNGALVFLRSNVATGEQASPVNVIRQLPRVSLSSRSLEGGAMENFSSRGPLTIYDGEQRSFLVEIENTGTESISAMRAKVFSSHPEALEITSHELGNDSILEGLENQGCARSFLVEVLGKRRSVSGHYRTASHDFDGNSDALSVVSVVVEYEGENSAGLIRESGMYVKVSSKAAVLAGRLDVLDVRNHIGSSENDKTSEPVCCVALEVRNCISALAAVKLCLRSRATAEESSNQASTIALSHETFDNECLVESGTCARLLSYIDAPMLATLTREAEGTESANHANTTPEDFRLQLFWNLPALGRKGHFALPASNLLQSMENGHRGTPWGSLSRRGRPGTVHSEAPRLAVLIDTPLPYSCSSGDPPAGAMPHVRLGRFWPAQIRIWGSGDGTIPLDCVFDLEILQFDDAGAPQSIPNPCIVGATRRVFVSSLPPSSSGFFHKIRIRMNSTGVFKLCADLYHGSRTNSGHRESNSPFIRRASETRKPRVSDYANVRLAPSGVDQTVDIKLDERPSGSVQAKKSFKPDSTSSQPFLVTHAEETPRALKRVVLTKTKRVVDEKEESPINTTMPTTIDSCPEGLVYDPQFPTISRSEASFVVV